MKNGLVALVLAYVFSQFYRAFLPVLTPALGQDIGATAADLATASSVWFLIFAVMQIPVGAALDRVGPRRTAVALFVLGCGGGCLVFAMAQAPIHILIAMGLIGVGCSPVLMASYFIIAKTYAPAIFATLAGAVIGIGSIGNIAGSVPLAWAVSAFGWRETMVGLGVFSTLVGAALWIFVRDPAREEVTTKGSVLDLLKLPLLWPIFAMMLVNYAPSAAIRGLWAGPYAADVYQADAQLIGTITLVMGLAMIAGSFLYGPLERFFGARKWVVFWVNGTGAVALLALFLNPEPGVWVATALLSVIGFAGASFPVLIAHAKAFFPAHLTGRGVTLLNLFGIGGAGLMQMASGPVHAAATANAGVPGGYGLLFAFFGVVSLLGLLCYLFARERTD